MEKYKPMPAMHMPYSPHALMPSPMPMPMPLSYAPPVTLHASFEEINIYEQKKHPHHFHYLPHGGGYVSAGAILVLFILLVIILRAVCK
jgi:hypothetical protein